MPVNKKGKKYEVKDKVQWVGQHRKGHVTIDKHVPKDDRSTLVDHEYKELYEEDVNKLPYKKAHRKANELEKKENFTTKDGKFKKKEWRAYEKVVNKIYRGNLAETRKEKKEQPSKTSKVKKRN